MNKRTMCMTDFILDGQDCSDDQHDCLDGQDLFGDDYNWLEGQDQSQINEDENQSHIDEDENQPHIDEDENQSHIDKDENQSHIDEDENQSHIDEDENQPHIDEDDDQSKTSTRCPLPQSNPNVEPVHIQVLTPRLQVLRSRKEVTAVLTMPKRGQRSGSPPPPTASTTITPLITPISASKLPLKPSLGLFTSLIGLLEYIKEDPDLKRLNTKIKQTVALNVYPNPETLLVWMNSNSEEDLKVSIKSDT